MSHRPVPPMDPETARFLAKFHAHQLLPVAEAVRAILELELEPRSYPPPPRLNLAAKPARAPKIKTKKSA